MNSISLEYFAVLIFTVIALITDTEQPCYTNLVVLKYLLGLAFAHVRTYPTKDRLSVCARLVVGK